MCEGLSGSLRRWAGPCLVSVVLGGVFGRCFITPADYRSHGPARPR